jgi:hypothetical protein
MPSFVLESCCPGSRLSCSTVQFVDHPDVADRPYEVCDGFNLRFDNYDDTSHDNDESHSEKAERHITGNTLEGLGVADCLLISFNQRYDQARIVVTLASGVLNNGLLKTCKSD